MFETLKEKELEVATKLIFEGLSMAKSSMEKILRIPIELRQIDYDHSQWSHGKRFSNDLEKVHVIKTELRGQLKGTSHLMFTETEVQNIYKACLPPSIWSKESPENSMMKVGFLTEIDNMVAAAVITEFSNFLGVDIFGHVPSLSVVSAKEIKEYLRKESVGFDSIVCFKAIFHGSELDISPDFVWIFQEELVRKIKEAI